MHCIKYCILFMMTTSSIFCFAQQETVLLPKQQHGYGFAHPYHSLNDSIIVVETGGACRGTRLTYIKRQHIQVYEQHIGTAQKEDFLNIHGNVLYNFNYRSYIDTPFQQTGMVQHTVQTFMDGDIAGKYPFRAVFTYRGSNSPYFSNASDISVQYRQSDMLEKVKYDLRKDADSSLDKGLLENPSKKYVLQQSGNPDSLGSITPFTKGLYREYDSLYAIYAQKRKELDSLEQRSGNKNLVQAIIEAREAKLYKQARSQADSIAQSKHIWDWSKLDGTTGKNKNASKLHPIDSTSGLQNNADSDEAKITKAQDSIYALKRQVVQDENKILLFQKKLTDSVSLVKRNINQLNNPQSVNDYIDKNDTTERSRLSGAQKFLLSVNQIGIGRSWINYSPLTVSNISLNGFNIEMNPGNLYVAAAVGSVNSQFRDFILNNNTAATQSVTLVRLGIGKINKNNWILTMYTGRKALLNTTGINDSAATQQVAGASISTTRVVNKNTSVSLEYARSSYEDAYAPGQLKGLAGRVLNFNMNVNAAWAVNFKSVYPLTNTKIDGGYRKMGEAFQSFTIYATNVKQDAYLFHVNQLLWKKKLTVDASVRKNDFNSPLTAPGYSNASVFTAVQVSLAMPRYPFVSIGYYPSSQLFTGSNNVVYQSWYNTLNAISSYSYKAASLNMTTSAVYTKFYNNQSDTAFSYYNAGSFSLTHSVNLSSFMLQGNLTVTDQALIHLVTMEPLVTYPYKRILTLTGGIKYSRLNHEQTLLGGTAGMSILINHFGTIQFNYDKVYLPSYNGNLLPVDLGRITYNREF